MKFGIFVGCLLLATSARAQTACPLDEYEKWDEYETNKNETPIIIDTAKSMGFFKAFRVMEDDVTLWWVFAIEPGTQVNEIALTTTGGQYKSDLVLFTTWAQQQNIPCPATADAEYEHLKIKGKVCVVAFARFPSEPKGNVVTWSIK